MRILNWNANGPRAARRKGYEMSIGSGASQAAPHQSMHPEWSSSSTTSAGTPMGPFGPLRRGRSSCRWDSVGNGRRWRCCRCSGWTSRSSTTDSRKAARFRALQLVSSSSDSGSWGVDDAASELQAFILGLGIRTLLHGGSIRARSHDLGRHLRGLRGHGPRLGPSMRITAHPIHGVDPLGGTDRHLGSGRDAMT